MSHFLHSCYRFLHSCLELISLKPINHNRVLCISIYITKRLPSGSNFASSNTLSISCCQSLHSFPIFVKVYCKVQGEVPHTFYCCRAKPESKYIGMNLEPAREMKIIGLITYLRLYQHDNKGT